MIQTLFSLAEQAGHRLSGPAERSPEVLPALRSATDDPSAIPGMSLENPRTSWDRIFETEPTITGVPVSEVSSLQLAAVWRCVNLIAGGVARTPFETFERTEDGKQKAKGHYLWSLFRHAANPRLSSFRFRRMMQAWVCLWGNAYCEMEINGRGQIVALWPWRPDRVRVSGDLRNGLWYTYTDANNQKFTLPDTNIFHLRGLELDGVMGMSPIRAARQSLGLAMAAEQYGARYFGQSGKPGGWIEVPNKLDPRAMTNLRQSMADIHQGLRGAHRLGILEEGMKYHEVGVPPEDMQFLQTRQFQGIDVARLFGVPPHKIAELSRATFSNIEHQSIEFVQDCLGDWFENWEAEVSLTMLSERDSRRFFVAHDTERMMRSDLRSYYEALAAGRNNGWLSVNEIRDKLNMNRIEGGDTYLTALNMAPATTDDEDEPPDPGDDSASDIGENPTGDDGDDSGGDGAAAAAAAKKKAKKKGAIAA